MATSRFIWCLDNGHGSNTPGKRSPKLSDGRQLLEYQHTRAIVKEIAKMLKAKGIQYQIVTPELNDISLGTRVKRANEIKQSSIFISIHSNAAGDGIEWHDAHGVETFHSPTSEKGKKIAKIFQENLVSLSELRDRGVKEADFYVLKHTKMPAILTECGFYTNKEEVEKLLSEEYINRFATAHVAAILDIEENGI